ncbi:MAG: RNA 2',3'-cyclic phosphodiesterase [Comamonadaceae bacterium CG_4_9_14_3_um_filter_60_33]|nr:MAG: RNA 2',3'-cyclic phosphodiesterase [Comamonadaceae bacterium CG_4_10_14_3_um_filter_60_42]PJB41532.1 MAG: RNA 2',3'-cyclic phosphodiesterase [Comamonadaceae bacterium CG_4_9_14_3_um_filter_60_33]
MDTGQPAASSSQRLFLALWPDDSVRVQLAAHADQWLWPAGCVRYAPADWHVTLHFMGDVAAEKVQAIAAAVALPFQPLDLVFNLVFDQPRLWPQGLAVLCASELPAALKNLHEALGQALRVLDLALDKRPYMPHITLARHAEAAVAPEACVPVVWPVNDFALVLSTGQKQQRYRILRHYR